MSDLVGNPENIEMLINCSMLKINDQIAERNCSMLKITDQIAEIQSVSDYCSCQGHKGLVVQIFLETIMVPKSFSVVVVYVCF